MALFDSIGGGVSDIFAYEGTKYKEQGLQFEQQNYEAASQLALQNEQYTKTSTAIKQQQEDRNLFLSLGKTETAVGGAGLAESGNAVDILRQSAEEGAMTRAVTGQQGQITEAGYQEQSEAYANMASAAGVAIEGEKIAGEGDLIGAGFKFASAGIDLAGMIPG